MHVAEVKAPVIQYAVLGKNVAEAHNESASLSQTRQPVDSRLAALVRVANLKLIFSRRRDKKLIFEGLVQESLQHGHPFRLAAV